MPKSSEPLWDLIHDVSLWTFHYGHFIMDVSLSKRSIDVLISIKLLKGRRSIRDYYYPVMVKINFQVDTAEKVQLILKKKNLSQVCE